MSEKKTEQGPTTDRRKIEEAMEKRLSEKSHSIGGRHPPATKSSPTSVILCI